MNFEDLYNVIVPNEKGILSMVDEYTLYCYYTDNDNLLIGKAYPAPYRQDNIPSFSVFESNKGTVDYMWRDHATGESGTIFMLIQKIYGLSSREDVYEMINNDFALGLNSGSLQTRSLEKIVRYERPEPSAIKIRVINQEFTDKGKAYWGQFNIGLDLLKTYNTTQVGFYWTWDGQLYPITAKDPTFAYRIGEYYQLYSPFAEKEYKFRNDYPENYFFGYLQLPPNGDKLVIDKSAKDVIFCRRLGLYAVCGKSETTFIPQKKMIELKDRFKDIYLMLDNDIPGRKMAEKYKELYPWLKERFLTEAKDKTDLCRLVGFDKTQSIVHELTQS